MYRYIHIYVYVRDVYLSIYTFYIFTLTYTDTINAHLELPVSQVPQTGPGAAARAAPYRSPVATALASGAGAMLTSLGPKRPREPGSKPLIRGLHRDYMGPC